MSILIPAFNAERWIADTLGSALSQTWPNKEIVVVDDGSTDATLAIARTFATHDVLVLSQRNQGAAVARNHALAACHGEYVQWLDADDLLGPQKISLQMEAVRECPSPRTLFSAEWGRFMHRPHRTRFVPTELWRDLTPAQWLVLKMERNIYMQTSAWLVSRTLSELTGPWDSRMGPDDDGEYFARMLLHCDAVRFVPRARVYYRTAGFGTLSDITRSNTKQEAMMRSMKSHIQCLQRLDDSPRSRRAAVSFLETNAAEFLPERSDLVSEARVLAKQLGHDMAVPRTPRKCSLIESWFGSSRARQAHVALRRFKWSVLRHCDKWALRLERAMSRMLGDSRRVYELLD